MPKRGRESPPASPPPARKFQQAAESSTSQARRAPTPKPVWFHINKIEVGEWSHDSSLIEGLKAGIYCGTRKFVWELDHQEAGKRKMEVLIDKVRAMQFSSGNDSTGVMKLELKNPPTFYLEKEQDGIKNISQIDDFTTNESASNYRHHKITAATETLKDIQDAILKCNTGPWNDLLNKEFENSDDLHFTEAERTA